MSPIRLLKCCLNFTHLWCQESPALFSGSLGKPWSVSCVHPGSLGSRLSHSMSLGVDCKPHEDRSDTPVCLVVDLQTCSHTHWKQWKPLDTPAQQRISLTSPTCNLVTLLTILCSWKYVECIFITFPTTMGSMYAAR